MGFVGVWGAWYYSNNYATKKGKDWYEPTKAQQDDRNTIVKALINAVPSSRMLQLRYPAAKQVMTRNTIDNISSLNINHEHHELMEFPKLGTESMETYPILRDYG